MKTSNAKLFNKIALVSTVALAASWGMSTQAAPLNTVDSTLSVSANVVANCKINSTTAIAFGSYDPVDTHASTTNLDNSNGAIEVTCTAGTPGATIALGNGSSFDTTRRLQSGSNFLSYNLYTASDYVTVWNDLNLVNITEAAIAGDSVSYPVYARIPGGQKVPVGAYSDTVAVTVSF